MANARQTVSEVVYQWGNLIKENKSWQTELFPNQFTNLFLPGKPGAVT